MDGRATWLQGVCGLVQWSRQEVRRPSRWVVSRVRSSVSGKRPCGKLWCPGMLDTWALKTLCIMGTVVEY